MTERRTIGDAMDLSADKLAFIRTGKVEPPGLASPVPKTIDLPSKPEAAESEPEAGGVDSAEETKLSRRRRTRREPRSARQATEPAAVDDFKLSKSFRLRYSTLEALNDAWLDRKRRDRNAHIQDIAQEAVDDWLQKHGYID